jgi:hypothetical protein
MRSTYGGFAEEVKTERASAAAAPKDFAQAAAFG